MAWEFEERCVSGDWESFAAITTEADSLDGDLRQLCDRMYFFFKRGKLLLMLFSNGNSC